MTMPGDGEHMTDKALADKSVEDLLLLIGDQDLGYRFEAMDRVLSMGFASVYPVLESAVRNDANADLRNGAMEALVRFGQQSVSALVVLLRDTNEEVRNFSAVMLGDIASRDALYPLIDALRDPDVNVSHAAAEALGKIGDDAALLPLLQLLKGDFWLQYPAVVAMGEMADNRAVPHLIPLLEDELLREPAITALGRIGDERALPYLRDILCSQEGKSIAAATGAIVSIMEKGSSAAKDALLAAIDSRGMENLLQHVSSGGEGIGDTVTLLGLLGEKAAFPVLLTLLEEHDYEEVVKKAIIAMASAAPLLAEGLLRNSQKAQAVVLELLRRLHGRVPVDHLLLLFDQGTPEVRLEVLASLVGETGAKVLDLVKPLLENGSIANDMTEAAAKVVSRFGAEVVDPLCRQFSQSVDPGKRAVAALIAGYAAPDVFSDTLIGLLSDGDASVRQEAMRAAGKWKKQELLPYLVSALADVDDRVRREALFSLTAYGEDMPLPAVLQHLGKKDERLDYEIIMAMGRIGRKDAETSLVDYLEHGGVAEHLEFAVIETLGKIGSRNGRGWLAVSRYLGHVDPDIRRLAVQSLATIGQNEFIPEIAGACQDRHWSVIVAALKALGSSGSDRAIPFIAAALEDQDLLVRKNAVTALAKSGNALAVPELVKYIADPELGKPVTDALFQISCSHLSVIHAMATKLEPCHLRQRLISFIGKFSDQRSMELLVDLAKNDVSEEIRTAASHALVLRGGQTG